MILQQVYNANPLITIRNLKMYNYINNTNYSLSDIDCIIREGIVYHAYREIIDYGYDIERVRQSVCAREWFDKFLYASSIESKNIFIRLRCILDEKIFQLVINKSTRECYLNKEHYINLCNYFNFRHINIAIFLEHRLLTVLNISISISRLTSNDYDFKNFK